MDIKTGDVARLLFRPLQPAALAEFGSGKKGVLLDTGDLVDGEEIDFHAGHVWVSSVLFGKQNFGLETAVALLVNDPSPAIKGGYTIATNDGSIYQSTQLKLDGDKLIIEGAVAGTLAFNSGEVRTIARVPARQQK